jgi:hypothetical protein
VLGCSAPTHAPTAVGQSWGTRVSLTLTHHDEERVTHPSEKTPHLGRCTALTTVVSLLTPCPQQTPASSPQQSTRAPASTPAPTRDTQAVTMQKLKNAIKGHRHGDRADEVSVRGACVSSTLPGHVRAHACGALACAMRAAACGPPARHVHIAPRVQRSTHGAESDRRPGTHAHAHTHTHTHTHTHRPARTRPEWVAAPINWSYRERREGL